MALPVRTGDEHAEPGRWNPFVGLDRLNGQLTSYLGSWRELAGLLGDGGGFTPPADVTETDDAYLVEIELPGVKLDDLQLEVGGQRVSVRGERKARERPGIFRKRERTVGRFSYEVTLPGEVDEDHVDAHLAEGVLSVRLAKPERGRPRRITVH